MVRLRLARMGRKKIPHYRIVATNSRSPRDGRFLEHLGYYNPKGDPSLLDVDLARVDYWISVGAQPSETLSHLLERARKGSEASAAE